MRYDRDRGQYAFSQAQTWLQAAMSIGYIGEGLVVSNISTIASVTILASLASTQGLTTFLCL